MNNQQQQKAKGGAKPAPKQSKQPKAQSNQSQGNRRQRRSNSNQPMTVRTGIPRGVGNVVAARVTRTGVSDIRRLRLSWVAGYVWVGDGTDGAANGVYFQSRSSNYFMAGNGVTPTGGTVVSSGWVPIAASDADVGQTYISDLEKHFSRKVIHRMWVHIDSLQPSTQNNMMAVIAFSRGGSGAEQGVPFTPTGNTSAGNTVANLSSVKEAFTVNSWESKTVEITDMIAGGSGSRQNEFDIQTGPGAKSIWAAPLVPTTLELSGVIPACMAVAGNSTTAGLQSSAVHQIVIEQEVDLLDYIGGMANTISSD